GVTEFKITTPVTADNSTEGDETVTYTVGGVTGNEATIKDTSTDNSADSPTVTPSTNDGSVTVTPGGDNTKLEITYTDEDGAEQTVTFTKDPDTGKWVDGNPNDGVSINPDTGIVTIPQDA
ncbi:hypothetical protein H0G77_11040, partial [[Pasteurella] aerogenes]|nr:hypothetical protein [[Pasteurella] aerogenes]